MRLSIIVAAAENGAIGRDNALPWHLPGDLAYFRRVTMGKPVVMGRKTFESIGRPLPGRTNIVITRDRSWRHEGVHALASLEQALVLAADVAVADGADELMVIGGAEIYAAALPLAARVYLTEVHAEIEGDVFFPELDRADWREVSRERQPAAEGGHDYSFVVLERS